MWVGQRRKELEMHTAGKKLKQRDNVVYVGGTICGDGSLNNAICSRIETETNARKKVEGMMGDRQNYLVYYPCIHVWLIETTALTEKQQKVQISENKWIRIILGMNGADMRRMDELRMEAGVIDILRRNVEECEMRNWQREQLLRDWKKMRRRRLRMC